MTDNRTTELREGLTEHGIEWRSGLKGVTFVGDWCFVEYDNGKLAATCEPVLTPEQAIAATLGGGKLTAEQVEKAIHDCSTYASYDGCTYYASGIRLQAIADELNAGLYVNAGVDDTLAILDEIRYEDRISYDDYSRLFDAIAAIAGRR